MIDVVLKGNHSQCYIVTAFLCLVSVIVNRYHSVWLYFLNTKRKQQQLCFFHPPTTVAEPGGSSNDPKVHVVVASESVDLNNVSYDYIDGKVKV